MIQEQSQALEDYYLNKISREALAKEFGEEIENIEFIKKEVRDSLKTKDKDEIERAILLIWLYPDIEQLIDELNILLLEPNHYSHQLVTKTIQDIGNSKSTPFIKKALESGFDYLDYTCSESEVIAKWFSHALYSIGTQEAIDIIKEFSKSADEGISKEMNYRLQKVKKRT